MLGTLAPTRPESPLRTENEVIKLVGKYMFHEAHVVARLKKAMEVPSKDVVFVRARTGLFSVRKRGVALESVYDPLRHAIDLIEAQDLDEAEMVILVGCGGGTLPEVVVAATSDRRAQVAVYEPDIHVLAGMFRRYEDLPKLDASRTQFFSHLQSLKLHVAGNYRAKGKLIVVCPPAYHASYPGILKKLQPELEEAVALAAINFNTAKSRAKEWVSNAVRNIGRYNTHPVFDSLEGKFKGIPAVMVAAGPSLDKNIRLLKDVQDDVLILCVNTSLKALLSVGVTPHFVMSLESLNVTKQFDDIPQNVVEELTLILDMTCNPAMYGLGSKRIFPFIGRSEIFKAFAQRTAGHSVAGLMTGASVANGLLSATFHMGCDPIIMVGQDLAYTGGKVYAKGTVFEDLHIDESNPDGEIVDPRGIKQSMLTQSSEGTGKSLKFYSHRYLHPVKAWDGEGVVQTSMDFKLFATWFQEVGYQLRGEYGVTTINATEGGMHLDGFTHIPLAEALAAHVAKGAEHGLQARIEALHRDGPRVSLTKIREGLAAIESDCRTLRARANDALKELDKVESTLQAQGPHSPAFAAVLKAYEETEQRMSSGTFNKLVEAIIESEISTIIASQDHRAAIGLKNKYKATFKQSRRLLNTIVAAAGEVSEDLLDHLGEEHGGHNDVS